MEQIFGKIIIARGGVMFLVSVVCITRIAMFYSAILYDSHKVMGGA